MLESFKTAATPNRRSELLFGVLRRTDLKLTGDLPFVIECEGDT